MVSVGLLQAQRPTIGLVLEGGGALGFAHVGVLQWLEDHHVPVDYVAGTSMGGLIGGLYASGHSPAEIRTLAKDVNWDRTLSGEPSLRDLNFRRKEDRVDYPSRIVLGLKNGLSLPGGLNGGQEIGLILDRAVLPYYDLRSFNELPIPFRCVATDMVSGKQVIFDHGSLATALRATMSIPAVFAPVRDGDRIYTDGGALNNLPVDVAKSMGADVIIAVFLNQGVDDPKTFDSILGAAGRNIAIMIAANEIRSMQEADVLVSVDLKGYTAGDFSKSEEIVPKGAAAAAKKAGVLERFAVNDSDWLAYLAQRDARRRTRVPEPTFVAVKGVEPELQPAIKRALSDQVGKPLDPNTIEKDLRRLNGEGYFDSLGYTITTRDDRAGLEIEGSEKTYAPPFLNLGVDIDGTDTNDIRFGMASRLTFLDLGGYRSELRVDGSFGFFNGLRAEYSRPFTKSTNWFVAPRAYATDRIFEVYEGKQKISQYRLGNSGLGADVGYSFSSRAEVRIGEAEDWQSGKLLIGEQLVPNGSYRREISSLAFRYLGQDDPIIPRRGFVVDSGVNYFDRRPNQGSGFTSAAAKIAYFQPLTAKASSYLISSGGTAFGTKGLGADAFALGGPFDLGAYGRNALLGSQYYLFQAGYLQELFKLNPIVGNGLYAVGSYEFGKMYQPILPNTPKTAMDVAGAIVVETLLGPAYIGGSIGESGRRAWWFGLGRIF